MTPLTFSCVCCVFFSANHLAHGRYRVTGELRGGRRRMTSTAKEHLPLGGRMQELFSPLSPATLKTSPAEQNTIPVCVSTAPLPGRIKLVKKKSPKSWNRSIIRVESWVKRRNDTKGRIRWLVLWVESRCCCRHPSSAVWRWHWRSSSRAPTRPFL